jgi:glycogen operon protein
MAFDLNQWYPGNVAFPAPRSVDPALIFERLPTLKFTHPLPYGAIVHDDGVQFVVMSRSATAMRVLLYNDVKDPDPYEIIDFDRDLNRWGDIWSVFVPGMVPGQLYHFQADGPWDPDIGHRFDARARLIDPYAKALAGCFLPPTDGVIRPPKCVVIEDEFDWKGDRHLRRDLSETIIYETHVRGYTKSRSSRVKYPGTYLGLIEKIPYLRSLGITAVELMPVHEFPINDCIGQTPERPSYWGYDPMAFFAPHRGYAVSEEPGAQVREFKEMVLAMHQAGIEVILDVVFNHTCEGNEHGPTISFKGLENQVYYMLQDGGKYYRNYSGCGNTVNGNHPIVREMIFNCLRHWVHNYHIDGFRFDLASILSRDRAGNLVANPPVIEAIAEDPLLADTKIIAEAWDAAGGYQVGTFGCLRWAEWNGRYRDDVRKFWRGDPGMTGALATRLTGSSDLYEPGGRRPLNSINFVTSHDGFTMNDLVSYNQKHNEANLEENRDGDNNNESCNYGYEGPTRKRAVSAVRSRQIRNFFATLLLSQGVPMIVAGDEFRRTQGGNNNAYCQDNPISWLNWKLHRRNEGLVRFVRGLIAFRKSQRNVRQPKFLTGRPFREGGLPDVSWFGATGGPAHWADETRSLTCVLSATPLAPTAAGPNYHLMMFCHGGPHEQEFVVPPLVQDLPWRKFIETAAREPNDIFPSLDGPALPPSGRLLLTGHAMTCYVAPDWT